MPCKGFELSLQDIPKVKEAYKVCTDCKLTEKFADHKAFLNYADERARRKIGNPDADFRAKVYLTSLKEVIESYVENGGTIEYMHEDKTLKINIRNEYRKLGEKVGGAAAVYYLTWSIAKLREILVLEGSSILISKD